MVQYDPRSFTQCRFLPRAIMTSVVRQSECDIWQIKRTSVFNRYCAKAEKNRLYYLRRTTLVWIVPSTKCCGLQASSRIHFLAESVLATGCASLLRSCSSRLKA